jgi:hypothetical protein
MYQNVLAVVNDHQSVWNGVQGMTTVVDQLHDLLNTLQNKLNLQSTLTQGIQIEKQAYLESFTEELSILKKALFLYAAETNNLALRERHKESKSKVASLSPDRLEILSINLIEDLETYESSLGTIGITAEKIQQFKDKAAQLENYKNSVRQAIVERSTETSEIRELEKQINRLLIDRLDRFMSFYKATDSSFFKTYRGARKIIGNSGNTGTKPNDQKNGSVQ